VENDHKRWETLLEELRTEFLLREQELELLHDIDLYILKDNSRLDDTFTLIANRAKVLIGADHTSILLRRGKFLETTYSSDDVAVGERVAIEGSITGKCVTNQVCISIDDIPASEFRDSYTALESVSGRKMLSLVAVPVDINGDVVGVICVESMRRAAFSETHTNILNAITSQVAIALQRVQNFDRDALFTRLDAMMLEPSASQLMIQMALTEVIAEIDRLGVKAKGAQILFRKGEDELEIVHSTNESDITVSVDISHSICGRAVTERRTIVVGDVTKDSQYRRMLGSTIQSEIAIPLTLGHLGYVIGVLNVESEELDAFTGYYQIVLDAFADKVRILLAFAKLRADVTDALEKRQAADLVATVGDQATNMVHRLNNQVGALRVHISDLLDDNDQGNLTSGPDLHDRLSEMLDLAKKTLRMPNEVTKIFSREGSPVDVNDIISGVLQSAYIPDGLEVITEFAPGLPRLSLYSFDLVVENLTKNAIQAMEEKCKTSNCRLTISTRLISYAELSSGYVEVGVADTGSGIKQDVLPHIFDLNYSTKRSKSQGLGLGLWWVKNFIYRSDGEIKAYSTPGVGSKFVIKLPISAPDSNLAEEN
jgi:signal transduction histidine kinase